MSSSIEPLARPLDRTEILELIKEWEKELGHPLISFWEYEPSFIHVTTACWNERGGYKELNRFSFKR